MYVYSHRTNITFILFNSNIVHHIMHIKYNSNVSILYLHEELSVSNSISSYYGPSTISHKSEVRKLKIKQSHR